MNADRFGGSHVKAGIRSLDSLRGWRSSARRGMLRAFEARGDDRDADVVAHVRVDDRAEDHVHIGVSGLTDDGRGLVHLEEGHVRAAGHVEEHAARAVNRDVEQLARDRSSPQLSSLFRRLSLFPTAMSAAPPSDMMARTSAKSRLIKPGMVISSEMPWMP